MGYDNMMEFFLILPSGIECILILRGPAHVENIPWGQPWLIFRCYFSQTYLALIRSYRRSSWTPFATKGNVRTSLDILLVSQFPTCKSLIWRTRLNFSGFFKLIINYFGSTSIRLSDLPRFKTNLLAFEFHFSAPLSPLVRRSFPTCAPSAMINFLCPTCNSREHLLLAKWNSP